MILDDGAPSPVRALSEEQMPLDIVLVCPTFRPGGALFANYFWDRVRSAASTALMGAGMQDRVAIVAYGSLTPRIHLPFTSDRGAIAESIRTIDRSPAVAAPAIANERLALEYAIRMLAEITPKGVTAREQRRRLILVIHPAVDFIPTYSNGPVIRELWRENIILSTVDNIAPAPGYVYEHSGATFRQSNPMQIALATGGDAQLFHHAEEPLDPLTRLRQRYVLWFEQPEELPPGQTRKIVVDLTPEARKRFPDAVVQAREGYVTR